MRPVTVANVWTNELLTKIVVGRTLLPFIPERSSSP